MEMQWSGQMRMHCRHAMQRSMSTVRRPRLRSNVCFLYSGYCRVTLLSKRCLRVIPIPFRIPCPSWGISKTFPLKHRREHEHRTRGDEQPDQAGRHEYLPAEIHELVHPEARQAPPHPLEGKDDERCLQAEPDPVEVPEVQRVYRRLPSPEEQGRGDRGYESHRCKLRRLYKRPRHPGVLDHEPSNDLALPLRQIERHPPSLRQTRDIKRDEHGKLRQKVPVPEPTGLCIYDIHEREASRQHDDPEQAQYHRYLVGDHLRRAVG